ncbi:MAG: type IV pilus modification protein PilV [Alcanivoracaceae bacterium]|nr:type IV pilus modification protein PilV [Alcanivoracaceae bacterium]
MLRTQRGVGMIEILVAILVVAVGVLGYAGMQMFALRGAETASYRTQATLVAKDALERLLLNSATAAGDIYFDVTSWPAASAAPGGNFPTACMGAATCTPDAQAVADIAQLSWIVSNTLPLGMISARDGCTGVGTPSCVVVTWQGTVPADCLAGGVISTSEPCVVMEARRP